jgi:hypothetical protein
VSAVKGGVVAGLLAGTVSAIVAAAISLASGENLWVSAKIATYPFFGERALQPLFEPDLIVFGALIHFAVSVGWSVAFAVLMHGRSTPSPIITGTAWGVVVWLVMFYVALPLVGAEKVVQLTPLWRAIVEHLIFGLSVSFAFLPFQPNHHSGNVADC